MNKLNLSNVIKNIKIATSKHSPEILTGIGIAGMISTTILAVKATPKALKLIDDAEDAKIVNEGERLTKTEIVKVAWKPYIPAIVTGVASVTCLIGASSVNAKRNAALATAYELSKTALSDYKEKVIETVGEKKEQIIRDKVDQDKIDKNPVNKNNVIITNNGDALCYDGISGRYFKSDMDTIKKAINEVNREMTYSDYISLSEFYDEIGLEHTDISDYLGWNIADGLLDVTFGSRIASDGTPCITLDYRIAPRYDYSKNY